MARATRKAAKEAVGLLHVEAALEMVTRVLEDVRLVVAELRQHDAEGLLVRIPPGLPCLPGRPGVPCRTKPGEPCRTKPGPRPSRRRARR